MTWMTDYTRNDFNTFRETFPPLLSGDYSIWPRWQVEHFGYLLQLTAEAVARANCGVEGRLRAVWGGHEEVFVLYLRSFAHESLATTSPRGTGMSFALPGVETPSVVRSQLDDDSMVVLIYNPTGLASVRFAVPVDDGVLAVAADENWADMVRQLIDRADIVVVATNILTSGVSTEWELLREAGAQDRTVVLLAQPPDDLTLAYHEAVHHAPIPFPGARASADQFGDFPLVVDRWDARDADVATVLRRAVRAARDGHRPTRQGNPPELPPVRVDERREIRARQEMALATRDAEAGRTKQAILRFTAAVYTGYEACSIPAMLTACAQLARWAAALGDPMASDYRQLHSLFAVGMTHGLAAMGTRFSRWVSGG